MARKIYIASNFSDQALTASLPPIQKNLFGLRKGDFLFAGHELASQPAAVIDAQLCALIGAADAAIFLLGDQQHTSPLIEREAELAIASGLLILGARIRGSTNPPPARLRYWKKYREVKLREGTLEEGLAALAKTL